MTYTPKRAVLLMSTEEIAQKLDIAYGDAEFIKHAVNQYHPLLDALEWLVENRKLSTEELWTKARTAIKTAKGT